MIALEPHAEGVVLPVRALPGASKSGLRGVQEGQLKVAVTQVAEKGKANQAVLSVLGKSLGLRKSQLALISGETAKSKRILVRDIDADELQARIATALAETS